MDMNGDKIIALFLKKHWGKPAPSLIVSNKWIVSSPYRKRTKIPV